MASTSRSTPTQDSKATEPTIVPVVDPAPKGEPLDFKTTRLS